MSLKQLYDMTERSTGDPPDSLLDTVKKFITGNTKVTREDLLLALGVLNGTTQKIVTNTSKKSKVTTAFSQINNIVTANGVELTNGKLFNVSGTILQVFFSSDSGIRTMIDQAYWQTRLVLITFDDSNIFIPVKTGDILKIKFKKFYIVTATGSISPDYAHIIIGENIDLPSFTPSPFHWKHATDKWKATSAVVDEYTRQQLVQVTNNIKTYTDFLEDPTGLVKEISVTSAATYKVRSAPVSPQRIRLLRATVCMPAICTFRFRWGPTGTYFCTLVTSASSPTASVTFPPMGLRHSTRQDLYVTTLQSGTGYVNIYYCNTL
jgi:hypothetical protein